MFWYVEQFSIIAIHFNSTYFNQFFYLFEKIVCSTSASGSKMVPKLILIFFFQNAMKVMCLTDEEISDVLQVISGVLQLGNVHFMAAGGAQIAEKSGMLMLQLIVYCS